MNARIGILALGTFAIGTDGFVIAGVLPQIVHGLGGGLAQGGLLVTAFALTYGLSALPLTVLLARVPRRRLLSASMLALAAVNAAAAVTPSFGALLGLRVLAALAAAAYSPAAMTAAVQISSPDRRARAVSLVLSGMTVSLVAGVPLGSLLGEIGSWRWTFGLVAALSLAASIGVSAYLPDMPVLDPAPVRTRLRLLSRPPVLLNLLAPLLWLTGTFAIYTYIAPVLLRATGWGTSAVSGMLLVYGAAAFAGNIAGGHAADRWGGTRSVSCALVVTGLAFTVLCIADSGRSALAPWVTLLALACWGVAGWSLTPAQSQRLLQAAPDAGPEVLSLNTAAIYLGIAAGSAVGGRVLTTHGLAGLGATGAALQVIALLAVLATATSRRRPQPTAQLPSLTAVD